MFEVSPKQAANPASAADEVRLAEEIAVTKEERERRLLAVADKLLGGMSRFEIVPWAMQEFGVGRRAAQRYVQTIEKRLHQQGLRQSPFAYYQLSKLQRDKLYEWICPKIDEATRAGDCRQATALLNAAGKLLRERDRAAKEMFLARNAKAERRGAQRPSRGLRTEARTATFSGPGNGLVLDQRKGPPLLTHLPLLERESRP